MQSNKLQPVIHVGFPKCASTFLQATIFEKLKSYKVLDYEPYNELGTKYLEDIDKNSPIFSLPDYNNSILSNEGYMHYDLPLAWRKYGARMRRDIFVSNIKLLFRSAGKLIVVIRRQDALIESWLKYAAHFQHEEKFFVDYPVTGSGFNASVGDAGEFDLKAYKTEHLANKFGTTYTHVFDYFDILKNITAEIPRERICILTVEDLSNDKRHFFTKLGGILEENLDEFVERDLERKNVSSNPKKVRSLSHQKYLRPIRGILPRSVDTFAKNTYNSLFGKESSLSESFRIDIMSLYKDSNRRLAKDFDLDIEKYGYY